MAKSYQFDPDFKLELVSARVATPDVAKTYRSADALNQSYLKDVLGVSPSYAEYRRLNPEETPALAFGTALHTQVLEPNDFNKRYAILPDCDRRTKEGKGIYEAFCVSNAGKTVLKQDDFAKLVRMASISRKYFDEKLAIISNHEQAIFGTFKVIDGEFKGKEVDVKALLDAVYVFPDHVLIKDLKSVADIANVTGASYSNGWAVQSAFYHDLVQKFSKLETKFEYVAQSKDEPYDVRIGYVSDEMFIKGRMLYQSAINRWLWWNKNGRPETAEFLGKQALNG